MSYQGKMIKTETTGVLHLRALYQVITRHQQQQRLKQGTISICIEECIGGGGITPCRRKLAKMTGLKFVFFYGGSIIASLHPD